jgi:hypothetical protein
MIIVGERTQTAYQQAKEYITKRYRVPAQRGGKVQMYGKPGVIVWFKDSYIGVRVEGMKHVQYCHPMELYYECESPSERTERERRHKQYTEYFNLSGESIRAPTATARRDP